MLQKLVFDERRLQVELAGVTRGKNQGNKGVMACAGTLRLPLLYETLDAAAGTGVALSLQIFE